MDRERERNREPMMEEQKDTGRRATDEDKVTK